MAIANIFRRDGGQTVIYEDGRVVHVKSDLPAAKPIWVVTARKVRFTMYDDGRVERETGRFTPDEPILHTVYPYPDKPQKTGYRYTSVVDGIYDEDVATVCYRRACAEIDCRNDIEYARQRRAFKKQHKADLKHLKFLWKVQQKELQRAN